jgi:MoaA/NifB/PqqE/SkfB family radical SAM enzyme
MQAKAILVIAWEGI